MWLCTTQGFFSIVAHKSKADCFLLRWRFDEDTVTVRRCAAGAIIQETPNADYAFRAEVSGAQLQAFLAQLADGIDYPNFKNAAEERGQAAKLLGYHELWHQLRTEQERASLRRSRTAK